MATGVRMEDGGRSGSGGEEGVRGWWLKGSSEEMLEMTTALEEAEEEEGVDDGVGGGEKVKRVVNRVSGRRGEPL